MAIFTTTGSEQAHDIVHMIGNKDLYTITENAGVLTYTGSEHTYINSNVDVMGFKGPDITGSSNFNYTDEVNEMVTAINYVSVDDVLGRGMEIVTNGTQLTHIGDPWGSYSNLPTKLQNQWGTTNVNDPGTVEFTVTQDVVAYLIRADAWNAVPLTGWITDSTGIYLGGQGTIYKRVLTTGIYNFETYSAMYIFTL